MLFSLRVLSVLMVFAVTFPAKAIAGNERDFSRCPANWAPYVELVEQLKSAYPQISNYQFLFVSFEVNVHNCLKESFSNSYLTGLQSYLRPLREVIETSVDANSAEACAVTAINSGPESFSAIWLPYDDEVLQDVLCKNSISNILADFIDAGKF